MKTTLGEVKSIYDLFEKEIETSRNPSQGGDVIYASSKCKICGDELKGMSVLGSCMVSSYGDNLHLLSGQQKKHINLHETINKLGI